MFHSMILVFMLPVPLWALLAVFFVLFIVVVAVNQKISNLQYDYEHDKQWLRKDAERDSHRMYTIERQLNDLGEKLEMKYVKVFQPTTLRWEWQFKDDKDGSKLS